MRWSKWLRTWVKRMWVVAVSPLATMAEVNRLVRFAWDNLGRIGRLHNRVERIERHLHLDRAMGRLNKGKNRNKPCRCDSGRKFKDCCGKSTVHRQDAKKAKKGD